MANLHEYPQSGNLVERGPILKELEEKYQAVKNAPLDPNDGFSNITPDELYWLGKKILSAPNIWQAYNILAEPSKSGLPYYDLVIGPQHLRALGTISVALNALFPEKVESGLDIGAGTGTSTLVLTEKCQKITAVDLNPNLLSWTKGVLEELKNRRTIDNYQTLVGNAITLPFPPNKFDIVIAHGLDSYLTPDEIQKFYQEVYRVLKPGGSFFKYFADLPSNHPAYSTSYRAELAGVIAKALLSFSYAPFYQISKNFLIYEDFPFNKEILKASNSPYNERVLWLTK
jgi:ubiquinone/menaquinone biosynthesis C-methylase UbiE